MEDRDLIQFFKDHAYVVRVYQSEGRGCTVCFPSKIVTDPDISDVVSVYQIQEGSIQSGIHYYSSDTNNTSFVECPPYASRILVFQDILMKTESLGLSSKFISYHRENGNEFNHDVSFVDIIKSCNSQTNRDKEEKLAEIFYAAYPNFTKEFLELSRKEEVAEGYELIHLAFLMEGM